VGSTCMTCSTLLSAFGPCMIVTSRRHAERKDNGSSHFISHVNPLSVFCLLSGVHSLPVSIVSSKGVFLTHVHV
jgi:hypothetical protein